MALNRKTFKKAAAGAAADTNLPSGYFNTVTYTGNGGTQRIGGYINRGAVFNGSSSYIDLNGSVISVGSFSISLWVNWNNVTNQSRAIHLGNGDDFSDISIFALNGNATVRFADSGSNYRDVSFSVSTNQWYHISMTYDISNNNYKVYLNGTQQGSTIVASGFTTLANYGAIGARIASGGASLHMRGKIDQVRIFDKAISSSEVTTLYEETHASTTISTTDIFNDNSGVALYQLDGNANDTGGVSGYIGGGAIFNGSSASTGSRISLSNNVYGSSTTVFSASLWVKCTNTAGEIPIIGNGSTVGGTTGYVVYINSGSLTLSFANGSSYDFFYGQSINDNNWHHIVITYNNGAYVLYLDNSVELNGTSSIFLNNATPTYDTFLGNRWARTQDTSNAVLNGAIDQVRIYSKALSSSEVSTLYGETASSNITISDLVAYYPMDGNSLDQEGSYHGTDTNVEYNYSGTASNVTYQDATNFSPDLIWIKSRNFADNHQVADSVRGNTKYIMPNRTNAEHTSSIKITSFDSNGFTLGSDTPVNDNNDSFVAWCFNAGTDAAASNTDGSITSTVKANTDAGFSVVKYTAGGAANVGHGLSSAPELIITKNIDASEQWFVYAEPVGTQKFLGLNTTSSATSNSGVYTSITDSTFTNNISSTSRTYVNYCFHSVDGIQKVGSYTGTGGSVNVETGFEPAWIMIKRTDSTGNWWVFDNSRGNNKGLRANLSNAEDTTDADANTYEYRINFLSNGFQYEIDDSTNVLADLNALNGTYIYLAIAADPDTTTPTVEDSFEVVTYTGNAGAKSINTGFKPDLIWIKDRVGTDNHHLFDSIRGTNQRIISNSNVAENTEVDCLNSFDENGFTIGANSGVNASGENHVAWVWKAGDHDDNLPQINTEGSINSIVSVNDAAGFSIVKGTAISNGAFTVGHGLSSAPELYIIKRTDGTGSWLTFAESLGANKYLQLNTNDAAGTSTLFWNNTAPTSTVFSMYAAQVIAGGAEFIAYCFTSITGYQKIGSYTGGLAGSSNVIQTGFKPRFVLMKVTNTANEDWHIFDSIRGGGDTLAEDLNPNNSNAETNFASRTINFVDNGFYWSNSGDPAINASGYTYIYLAIA